MVPNSSYSALYYTMNHIQKYNNVILTDIIRYIYLIIFITYDNWGRMEQDQEGEVRKAERMLHN